MKRIVVLGSTGSIGVNTLKVVAEHPDQFQVVGLAAHNNIETLAQQVRTFRPRVIAIRDASRLSECRNLLDGFAPEILVGEEGVTQCAAMEGVDRVVVAITGAAALRPTLAAIAKGRTLGLANKETLVMAGELVMEEARKKKATLLPIDSEHSAIFQCLQGHSRSEIRTILLTTSGGPLRTVARSDFSRLTKAQIMNHPRWKMGPKITVDSATMMNKALEVIEARWLFDVPVDQVEVLVHPEAVIHSLVEFVDGSVLAQLALTDMRIPIQYALTYPERIPSSLPRLNLVEQKNLTFEAPDPGKFPCLSLGYQAAQTGGTAPAVLNAANEACVQAFLDNRLGFMQISSIVETTLGHHRVIAHPSLEEIFEADRWARVLVNQMMKIPITKQLINYQ